MTTTQLDHTRTQARGTRRRLQALAFHGWSPVELSRRCMIPAHLIAQAMSSEDVAPEIRDVIACLYEQLWSTPAPQRTFTQKVLARQMRDEAAANSWPPPLAWDDIDHDDELPAVDEEEVIDEIAIELTLAGHPRALTGSEKRIAHRILRGQGISSIAISKVLGVTPRTLDVLTQSVVDIRETSVVELELSRFPRVHGGLSCPTLMPG